MTEASQRALEGLRDPHTLQWYVIPLLALVFYVYSTEIKKARGTGDRYRESDHRSAHRASKHRWAS